MSTEQRPFASRNTLIVQVHIQSTGETHLHIDIRAVFDQRLHYLLQTPAAGDVQRSLSISMNEKPHADDFPLIDWRTHIPSLLRNGHKLRCCCEKS